MTNFESISTSVLDTVTGGANLAGAWNGTKRLAAGASKALGWGMKASEGVSTAMDLKEKFWGGGDDKKDQK